MNLYVLIITAFSVLLLSIPAAAGDKTINLQNSNMRLTVDAVSITGLQTTKGRINFIKSLKPEFWQDTSRTKVESSGLRAVVSNLEIWEPRSHTHKLTGNGNIEYLIDGKELRVKAVFTSTEPQIPKTIPWRWKTSWKRDGYDCTPKSGVIFSRFYTNNQRYMPIQQLKRRTHGGLSFDGCKWIEMDGNQDADLRLLADSLHIHWEMSDDEMSLRFDTPVKRVSGQLVSEWTLEVKDRVDDIPNNFPRFSCSDKKLESDLNSFWWERGFTYGAPPNGSIEFSEWMAMMRSWFDGPQHDGEIKHLINYPMTNEGYVHTYGDIVGWPLVPNRDTRHFDTNARFILACWRHYLWTGDNEFLKSQIPRLRKAMNYQLDVLHGKDGLIVTPDFKTGRHKDLSNNYWDILPFGHKDAYANAVFYASLEAMAQLEEAALGDRGVTSNEQRATSGVASAASDERAPEAGSEGDPILLVQSRSLDCARDDIEGNARDATLYQSAKIRENPRLNTPYSYRKLAKKVKKAYNDTFWLEDKGRYAGCVDIDGMVYDYGFTFVNLEALYYGLGDSEKARRIYKWMETEPTSSGNADTYSRWIFAPRATTIHNPMWGDNAPENERKSSVPPWWTYWWPGTPFGDQCQDGGAILYTSFFDLMDRLRFRGVENAWDRFTKILDRWRMPDRLCGGSPLYLGETSQQENAGSVGVDYPFPESGLVPLFFLYGVIGVEPASDGLHITPNLPDRLSYAGVHYMHYQNKKIALRVTRDSVEIECTDGTQTHKDKFNVKPGGSVFISARSLQK